jgi:hypothetical protein
MNFANQISLSIVQSHVLQHHDHLHYDQCALSLKPLHSINQSINVWRYSPFRALASLKACLHSSLCSALLLHPLTPSSCNASPWTTSANLVLGLPNCKQFSNVPSAKNQFLFPKSTSWSVCWTLPRHLRGFHNVTFFTGWGHQPHAQPPTWRTRVSLFIWVISFDLSGISAPASSYATAGLALRITWPHKSHHYVKVETPSAFYTHI